MLCAWCRPDAYEPPALHCFHCRQPSTEDAICGVCRQELPIDRLWIGSTYSGTIQQLIHLYKFERAQDVAKLLAEILDITIPSLPPETLVVYVPTATSRIRERGYDQARELAKAFAKLRGTKVTSLLRRIGQTRQVGASRRERFEQMDAAYHVMKAQIIKDARILLIDDIVTTGATLTAAARTLKSAGAKTVYTAAVARKQ